MAVVAERLVAERPKNVRMAVGMIFGFFFLVNVLLLALSVLGALKGDAPQILPHDLGTGVRLMIFVIGLGVSWSLGRWLYMYLIDAERSVAESSTAAVVMLSYLLLIFAGIAFLGGFSWIWQSMLLLVLLLMTLFGLAPVLGMLLTVGVIALCLAAGAALFFALS